MFKYICIICNLLNDHTQTSPSHSIRISPNPTGNIMCGIQINKNPIWKFWFGFYIKISLKLDQLKPLRPYKKSLKTIVSKKKSPLLCLLLRFNELSVFQKNTQIIFCQGDKNVHSRIFVFPCGDAAGSCREV